MKLMSLRRERLLMLTAEQYVRDGHWSRVPGPIDLRNLETLLAVGRFQEQLEIHGDLSEIGVFAGRYFILIHLLSRTTENVIAIDVFDDFSKNFDLSGGATALGGRACPCVVHEHAPHHLRGDREELGAALPLCAVLRVDPGHPERSALMQRAGSRYPALQMPPLGTELVDDEALGVLRRWIAETDGLGRGPQ